MAPTRYVTTPNGTKVTLQMGRDGHATLRPSMHSFVPDPERPTHWIPARTAKVVDDIEDGDDE